MPWNDRRSHEPSKYPAEEASLARAAAPRTPDLDPRVAALISARSRDGGLARSITSPASIAPPPTATTSGLKTLTNPASPPQPRPGLLQHPEREIVAPLREV